MNTDRIFAEAIANEYAPKNASKVLALKKLDRKAKRKANIFAYTFGTLMALVLGVGMNAYEPAGGFPANIAGVAGAIYEAPQPDGKNRLAAAFLNRFMGLWAAPEESAYAREYRRRSFVLGRRVTVLSREGTRSALALDVDEECRLVVRYDDGTLGRLSSGEISVRPEREEPV